MECLVFQQESPDSCVSLTKMQNLFLKISGILIFGILFMTRVTAGSPSVGSVA